MAELRHNPALDVPLSGRHLIEAGAGTGKTFAIKTIFLRLILEANLRVDSILTVTYTEAAAGELADRVRAMLESAQAILDGGGSGDGDAAAAVALAAAKVELPELRRRIALALRDFDEAMISTIHGFCARMLKEFAFENRRLFSMELSGDLSALIREIVYDYYRLRFYGGGPLRPALLARAGLSVETLAEVIRNMLNRPGATVHPARCAEPDFAALELELAALMQIWRDERARIVGLIAESTALGRAEKTYRMDQVEARAAELDRLAAGDFSPAGFAALQFFSAGALDAAVTAAKRKRGEPPPAHRFFDRADTFTRTGDLFSYWVLDALRFVEKELLRRREEQGVASYNDLLTDLAHTLQEDGGVADAIRRRFGAALIDEFQDTDPVQYEIFRRLFPVESPVPLYLVGDPKQAIYAFRGADIHTYAGARRDIPAHWALRVNFRSERRLVEAVNELFVRDNFAPFASELVTFDAPLAGAGRPEAEGRALLTAGRIDDAPLKLLYPSDALAGQYGHTAGGGVGFATELVVSSISRMLNDPELTCGGRRLRPSDFAILIAQNRQAEPLKRGLLAFGIPAILQKTGNVFQSPEAEKMQCLLNGMLNCESRRDVRLALALDLFGLTADQLLDDELLAGWQERFRAGAASWRQAGFITAFYQLLAASGARGILLGLPDGERRLTNYTQLAELLHRGEKQRKLGMHALFEFFRNAAQEDSEESEIRLESDRDAVTIVTVHKSKGMQYKIVFCPYLFTYGEPKASRTVCCRKPGDDRPVFDLEPDGDALAAAGREHFSEHLRLLYVALTRAENRCVVIQYPTGRNGCLEHIFGEVPALCPAAPGSAVERIAVDALKPPEAYRPEPENAAELALPSPVRRVFRQWALHSFSSLVGHETAADRVIDYDERDDGVAAPAAEPAAESGGIFGFPGGERTGNCFHHLLEELDFHTADRAAIRRAAAEKLALYGFGDLGDAGAELVAAMTANVLGVELAPGLRLADVPFADTRREMRFLFPVHPDGVPAKRLAALLAEFSTPEKPYALPERFGGDLLPHALLNGAIDLIFRHGGKYYILDWKSNRIDGRAAGFGPEGLAGEMRRNSYCLQYLLYTVALDRHLRRIVPGYDYETMFGGVFYCFLRGVDAADPARGVYRDLKPDARLIAELARILPEDRR